MKPQLEITCNVFGAARAYFEETILECEKLAHFPGTDLSQMEQTVRTRGIEQSRLLLQGMRKVRAGSRSDCACFFKANQE